MGIGRISALGNLVGTRRVTALASTVDRCRCSSMLGHGGLVVGIQISQHVQLSSIHQPGQHGSHVGIARTNGIHDVFADRPASIGDALWEERAGRVEHDAGRLARAGREHHHPGFRVHVHAGGLVDVLDHQFSVE